MWALPLALLALAGGCDGIDDPIGVPDPVHSVALTPATVELEPGDTVRLSAVARTAAGVPIEGRTFSWSSGDTAVASVDAGGLVTARSVGTAQITASTGGRSGQVGVQVSILTTPVPSITSLEPSAIQAGWGPFTLVIAGEDFTPFARVLWNEIPLGTVYLSSTRLHASVSAGLLASEGVASVVVENPQPYSERSAPAPFTIHAPPASSLQLLVAGNSVFVENRVRLDAIAFDQFGEEIQGKRIEWSSSDTAIARIDGDGWVRGRVPGQVILTAVAEPVSRTLSFSVLPNPDADLLFTSSMYANSPEAFVRSLGPGGGTERMLPLGTWALQATASPDGSRIAFAGFEDEGNNLEIFVVNRDGTGLQQLTHAPLDDSQPAWSPDGQRIAFRSWRSGKSDLWIMNADGTDQRNLTAAQAWLPGETNESPAWSPDGQRIAFSRGVGTGNAIYTIRPDGTDLRSVVYRAGWHLLDPAWSADGHLLAFRQTSLSGAEGTVAFAWVDGGAPAYLAGLDLPPDAGAPVWLGGEWLAVTGRAIPETSVRTVVLLRPGTGQMVVPVDPAYGHVSRPGWVRR